MAIISYNSPSSSDEYQDASEKKLLHFFTKHPQPSLKTQLTFLKENDSWPFKYHLWPQREVLLSWYPFSSQASLLEVGAGCGAVTGLFARKVEKVTANELTKSRADIIFHRYKSTSNIEVQQGNIFSLSSKKKYDYVTSIGVLEYAGSFNPPDKIKRPYVFFLQHLRQFLKPKGKLLLAIENRLGYKYLSGSPEDHLHTNFISLQNYPGIQTVKTFSYFELQSLLIEAGFKSYQFYFPFPDYKMPHSIFSEEGIDEVMHVTTSSFSGIVDYEGTRNEVFSPAAFAHTLYKEKKLKYFANSFLVEASI